MPNMIAYGALLAWPVVSLILFLMLPLRRAIIWSLLGAYLLLPTNTEFDFSGVPALDKSSIPNLVTFLFALTLARKGEFRWPRGLTVNLLLILYVIVPIITGFLNRDPIPIGGVLIPSFDFYSSLASSAYALLAVMPFIVGAAVLRDARSHRDLLVIYVMAALAYSIPILAEIRLSPFLAQRVYNLVNINYLLQQFRDGGFRSMVFLGHGLLVSTFCAMAVLAAVGLWRMRERVWSLPAGLLAAYLLAVLILNKSAGAMALALLIAPCLYLLRPRRFVALAFVLAAILMSYPALRSAGLVPTQTLLSLANDISPAREQSLAFRFQNEDLLLKRAEERPLFGWGGFGRNRVFYVTSTNGSGDASVTDGTWIITIGTTGWTGYVALFGLLCYPFWRGFKLRKNGLSMASVTLIAMHLLNLIDLIPNSSLRPMTWLVAGALSSMVVARATQGAHRPQPNATIRPRLWQRPLPA